MLPTPTENPSAAASDAPDEQQNIGVLLFVSYRDMENEVMAAIKAAGFADITLAQARIFQRVGPQGCRLTQLAEQAQVTKQTAGFLVDQLERARYVERTPDPQDARARLVRIGERGRAVQAVAQVALADIEARWAAHLGARKWAGLRGALERLREITDH